MNAIWRASCIYNLSKNNFQEMILGSKFVEVMAMILPGYQTRDKNSPLGLILWH